MDITMRGGTDIMTRTIAALLAVATFAGVAAPAAAQTKYYARERIVGMPISSSSETTPPPATNPGTPAEITYTPTYSTTYGQCTFGSQSAPIAKCMGSDGMQVANSVCGPARQQTTRSCTTVACRGVNSVRKGSGGTPYEVGTSVSLVNDALALCASYANANALGAGTCTYDKSTKVATYNQGGTTVPGTSNTYAGDCF
jgi:hypothetical protein